MKLIKGIIIFIGCATLTFSCGENKEEKKEKFIYKRSQKSTTKKKSEKPSNNISDIPASKIIDLTNKGIGPIKNIILSNEIDTKMANNGSENFKKLCSACHKIGKKFIGPPPNGILKRRTPEWVMNMILNPEKMVKDDPLAKKLLIEFNGAPMANQNLNEKQTRELVEYFRTLN
jgi:mono/diheme cytochrome c family protein